LPGSLLYGRVWLLQSFCWYRQARFCFYPQNIARTRDLQAYGQAEHRYTGCHKLFSGISHSALKCAAASSFVTFRNS
jgi:hypothetical protein